MPVGQGSGSMATKEQAENLCKQKYPMYITEPMSGTPMINPVYAACVDYTMKNGNTGPTNQQGGSGSWNTAENINATAQTIVALSSIFQRSPERQDIIAVCGRRPVFGAAQKATYNQCAQNVMNASIGAGGKQPYYPGPAPTTGMSSGAKIGIAIGVLVLIVLIILVIVKMRKK